MLFWDYLVSTFNDHEWIQWFCWVIFIIALLIWVAMNVSCYRVSYKFGKYGETLSDQDRDELSRFSMNDYEDYRANLRLLKIARRFLYITLPIIILCIFIPSKEEGKEIVNNDIKPKQEQVAKVTTITHADTTKKETKVTTTTKADTTKKETKEWFLAKVDRMP